MVLLSWAEQRQSVYGVLHIGGVEIEAHLGFNWILSLSEIAPFFSSFHVWNEQHVCPQYCFCVQPCPLQHRIFYYSEIPLVEKLFMHSSDFMKKKILYTTQRMLYVPRVWQVWRKTDLPQRHKGSKGPILDCSLWYPCKQTHVWSNVAHLHYIYVQVYTRQSDLISECPLKSFARW